MIASPPLSRPQALFDFAGSGTIDPRLTFTRASNATRINRFGYIETVPSGIPRMDYNPITGAIRGILIEQQSTNLLLQSEGFISPWESVNSAIEASTVIPPSGTGTAKKLKESLANAGHFVYQSANCTSGIQYTFSVYAKAGERKKIFLSVHPTTLATAFQANQAVFDLETGLVSGVAGCIASMSINANGFYRCSWTATATATNSSNFNIYLANNSSLVTYQGDNVSGVYLYGGQLEVGSKATSYIKTTTAQVTRAADSLSLQSSAFTRAINANEGAIYIDYEINQSAWPASSPVIACLSNGSGTGEASGIILSASNAGLYLDATVSSASQAALNVAAGTTSGEHRAAFSYKTDGFSLSADNATLATDSSDSIPSLTRIDIRSVIGTRHFNGHIKRIAAFPRYADSTIIQSITQ